MRADTHIVYPLVWVVGQAIDGNEERQCPDVFQHRDPRTVVDGFRKESYSEHGGDSENGRRDSQQVGLEGMESIQSQRVHASEELSYSPKVPEGKRKIRARCADRDTEHQATARENESCVEKKATHNLQSVERPEIIVADGFPKALEGETFTIVHIALGRVIADNARNDDRLFSLAEPPVWPEPRPRLGWRWWHHEERRKADEERQAAPRRRIVSNVLKTIAVADLLSEEQPPPTRPAEVATKVQHSISDKTCDNAAHVRRHPKECQPDGQLSLGVKVCGHISNKYAEGTSDHSQDR